MDASFDNKVIGRNNYNKNNRSSMSDIQFFLIFLSKYPSVTIYFGSLQSACTTREIVYDKDCFIIVFCLVI